MSTTESTAFETQSGEESPASGNASSNPYEPPARRQEILRADPYYPHTAWRAVVMWLIYFFGFLGFVALLNLSIPVGDLEWGNALIPALIATASVGSQWLWRKTRVLVLENSGQISPDPAGLPESSGR